MKNNGARIATLVALTLPLMLSAGCAAEPVATYDVTYYYLPG